MSMTIFVISIIVFIACIGDITFFIIQASGSAGDFMCYLCRPFGIHGNGISMFIGLIVRFIEVFLIGFIAYRLIEKFLF